jgi:hypothetical protein
MKKIFNKIKYWIKNHIVDDVPSNIEDVEFSDKFRNKWKDKK